MQLLFKDSFYSIYFPVTLLEGQLSNEASTEL